MLPLPWRWANQFLHFLSIQKLKQSNDHTLNQLDMLPTRSDNVKQNGDGNQQHVGVWNSVSHCFKGHAKSWCASSVAVEIEIERLELRAMVCPEHNRHCITTSHIQKFNRRQGDPAHSKKKKLLKHSWLQITLLQHTCQFLQTSHYASSDVTPCCPKLVPLKHTTPPTLPSSLYWSA